MHIDQINFYAVLACTILYMILGFIWYSLFSHEWSKLTGISKDEMKDKPFAYLGSFAIAFILSFVMAHFVVIGNAITFTDGAVIGAWAWLGFVATTYFSLVLWEDRPLQLYLINVSILLIAMVLIGGILAAWR